MNPSYNELPMSKSICQGVFASASWGMDHRRHKYASPIFAFGEPAPQAAGEKRGRGFCAVSALSKLRTNVGAAGMSAKSRSGAYQVSGTRYR